MSQPSPSADAVRAELDRILASRGFADAGRLGPFLKFLVENALAGDPRNVKESVLGVEVFQRPAGYNPSTDPIVRVEARRLRTRLEEYYKTAADPPVIISLPKGTYVPVFAAGVPLADDQPPGYQPPLRRKIFMLALCVLGLIVVWTFYFLARKQESAPIPAPPTAASVLVLPFANLSPDKENEYFAQGLTAELTDALTKVEGLRIIAYSSTAQAPDQDVRETGRRFHAGAVLEGSVRKYDDRLRITAQLIDAATGFHLWSETYERAQKDVFAVQEEIARAIVNSLRVQLHVDPNRKLASAHTQNLAAYNLYLRGRYHVLNPRSEEDLAKGVSFFEQAIQADPRFAAAYAAAANAYAIAAYYDPRHGAETLAKAKAAARKAIELDNSLAEAHASLGFALGFGDWDWANSEREFRRALELNPGSADAHHNYAIAYLAPTGHLDAARNESRLGVDLDPVSFFPNYSAAWILLASHQVNEAIEQYRKALDINSSIPDVWWDLGMAYAYAGKPQQALENFRHCGEMREGKSWEPGPIELALLGRQDEARKKAAGLKARLNEVRAIDAARAFALTGDKDAAFGSLEKALSQHDPQLIWLKIDPRFDPLRGDSRLHGILQRMGLP